MVSLIHFNSTRGWLRRGLLDQRLMRGADPLDSPALAQRAARLVSTGHRLTLADGLRRLIDRADKPHSPFTSQAPVQRREIQAARSLLIELADCLKSDERISPRGVILIERLLTDGNSPVYAPAPPRSLEQALRHARTAMLLD